MWIYLGYTLGKTVRSRLVAAPTSWVGFEILFSL